MVSNILEYLEKTAERVPERTAFYSDEERLTFAQVRQKARGIGTALTTMTEQRKPVALLLDSRSIHNIPAMYGVLYAGCFYAPMDISMPSQRLEQLLGLLQPSVILADQRGRMALESLDEWKGGPVLDYDAASETPWEEGRLDQVRQKASVYDPMSVLYTSGSTGIPKGSVQTQFSYIHWTEATIAAYGFDEQEVFGNQSPFFYANSIIDIFPPVALGAAVYLLPSGILNFPKKFVECLNRNRVTELTMTPSSFIGAASGGVLKKGCLPCLRYGIMSGESMPWEPLTLWMDAAPEASWWHFYGSTEMFSVAVGKIQGKPKTGEQIPVGHPFPLAHILFLDEEGKECDPGEPGELLLSSPWVAAGYYKDPVRTEAFWVTDPLNRGWQERFYRSGDLGYLREDGQLIVQGRKDSQIKHLGYRMELGEVEAALRLIPGWQEGCVLFQKEEGKLWCFFTGDLTEKELRKELKMRISGYMVPDVFRRLSKMPHTSSMKLDRAALYQMME